MHEAPINIGGWFLWECESAFLWDKCPKVGQLGHRWKLCLLPHLCFPAVPLLWSTLCSDSFLWAFFKGDLLVTRSLGFLSPGGYSGWV